MFDKKNNRKKSKSLFTSKNKKNSLASNVDAAQSYINLASSIFSIFSSNSQKNNRDIYSEIREEEMVYEKYLKAQKQKHLYSSNFEKIQIILSILLCSLFLIYFLYILELFSSLTVQILFICYLIYIFDILLKIITVPLKYEERIILTEQDRVILKRRENRKVQEELKLSETRLEEEEKRKQRERQNQFWGNVIKGIVEAQLSQKDKVYVKPHHRTKPKKR